MDYFGDFIVMSCRHNPRMEFHYYYSSSLSVDLDLISIKMLFIRLFTLQFTTHLSLISDK